MTTPYYGTHYDFNDELNIVEVPHAWVKRPKAKFMKWWEINPKWLDSYKGNYHTLKLKQIA